MDLDAPAAEILKGLWEAMTEERTEDGGIRFVHEGWTIESREYEPRGRWGALFISPHRKRVFWGPMEGGKYGAWPSAPSKEFLIRFWNKEFEGII